MAAFILFLVHWEGCRWPISPSSLVVLVPLTSCSRLDPFMPLRRKQRVSQVREALSCLAGQDSMGSIEPFASELDCDMASFVHEHLLVSTFCPSALLGRDLLKAGHDVQLSLIKTVSGSYLSFLFCLGLGYPTWWYECELLFHSRADLLVPLKIGSTNRGLPAHSPARFCGKVFPLKLHAKFLPKHNCT